MYTVLDLPYLLQFGSVFGTYRWAQECVMDAEEPISRNVKAKPGPLRLSYTASYDVRDLVGPPCASRPSSHADAFGLQKRLFMG